MNRQHLLSRLSDDYQILYTRGPWNIWKRNDPECKAAPRRSSLELSFGVKVDLPSRWLLRWPKLRLWDDFVTKQSINRWKKALPGSTPLIAYIFQPYYSEYIQALKPDYVVYHAYDRFSLFPGWSKASAEQQRKLTEMADLVIATSENTASELRTYRSGKVHVLPNGVDANFFENLIENPGSDPEDLEMIPRPRIGYVGTLNSKVDFAIIAKLAKKRPAWNFIFVGRQKDIKDSSDFIFCTQLDNVHFLGEKPRETSPRYVLGMDVNIINYRTDDSHYAVAGNPLKLYEYLAVGRPIVSCRMQSLDDFSEVIDICSTPGEWEKAIEQAIIGKGRGSVARRRAVARENSWEQRVSSLKSLLTEMVTSSSQK